MSSAAGELMRPVHVDDAARRTRASQRGVSRVRRPDGLAEARAAIERGEFGSGRRMLSAAQPADFLPAEVLLGDVMVRTGEYDEHYELAFRLARTYRLRGPERAALAVQAGEVAVLAANEPLARHLFAAALDCGTADPLLAARAVVGCTIAGLLGDVAPPPRLEADHLCGDVTAEVLRGLVNHLNPTIDPHGTGLARVSDTLAQLGLTDLGWRVRILAAVWMLGPHDPEIDADAIARCPWVTSAMLQRRLERCIEADFDYWSAAMEARLADGPHPSLVKETADVIAWSAEIFEQHQANVELSNEVAQAQAGWLELANLTSNEIRGLLTSLEVVTDLRQAGVHPPGGLELALVHRVAALTTMTQLGATAAPTEAEWPVEAGVPAAALLADIIDGSRPMFEWTARPLIVDIAVPDDVVVDVHPGLFADMMRWLLISATTGSLRAAVVEVTAATAGDRLRVVISSRTPSPPVAEHDRELGLGPDSTAHRAAVAILNSWGGRFSAVYSVAGLDATIDLATTRSVSDSSPKGARTID